MAITFVLYVVGNFQYDTFYARNVSGTGFTPIFRFPLSASFQHCFHTNHQSPPHKVFDSPDKATHYHTLCSMLGASSLTRHLVGKGKETLRNKNAFNSLVCLTERSGLVVNTPAS
jgi:hypothetical protein